MLHIIPSFISDPLFASATGDLCCFLKLLSLPTEVPHKKLSLPVCKMQAWSERSSEQQSFENIENRKTFVRTANRRLGVAGQGMQVESICAASEGCRSYAIPGFTQAFGFAGGDDLIDDQQDWKKQDRLPFMVVGTSIIGVFGTVWEVVCRQRDRQVRLTTGMLCVTINVEGDRVERQMKKGCAVCGIVVAIGLGNIPQKQDKKNDVFDKISVALFDERKKTNNK